MLQLLGILLYTKHIKEIKISIIEGIIKLSPLNISRAITDAPSPIRAGV